eukprot:CAMPEP_0194291236 /NCGR_PEP_ID=MMETSP0169-20130528/43028_1 /TAXON_ID=218684 /ORGANISM="Corethron pennatum, Strain L29A3" /LENGTH=735 /DNA_ID=CAMNT_0039039061 /DNA_START=45 /DNA_END=2252 /DNA_ORIENTATION=-
MKPLQRMEVAAVKTKPRPQKKSKQTKAPSQKRSCVESLTFSTPVKKTAPYAHLSPTSFPSFNIFDATMLIMKNEHQTPVRHADTWGSVYEKMRNSGAVSLVKGSRLVPGGLGPEWIYVLPEVEDVMKDGIKGLNFFSELDDLKQFAVKFLGWGGDGYCDKTERWSEKYKDAVAKASSSVVHMGKRLVLEAPGPSEASEEEESSSNSGSNVGNPLATISEDGEEDADDAPAPSHSSPPAEVCETEISGTEGTEDEVLRTVEKLRQDISEGPEGQGECTDVGDAEDPPRVEEEIGNEKDPSDADEQHSDAVGTLAGPLQISEAAAADHDPTVPDMLHRAISRLQPEGSRAKYGNRDTERETIVSFLRGILVNKQWGDGSLHICGRPGSGKTMVLQDICEEIEEWEVPKEFGMSLVIFENAVKHSNSNDSLINLLRSRWEVMEKYSPEQFGLALERKSNKRQYVLVLDEIDHLVSGSKAGKIFLHSLYRWSSDPKIPFTLIGIANSIDIQLPKLGTSGMGAIPNTVVFETYSTEAIRNIVEERAPGVFEVPALDMLSKTVSTTAGDARVALQMAERAVSRRLASMTEEEKTALVTGPVVRFQDVRGELRSAGGEGPASLIRGLPGTAKLVLCVLVGICRERGEEEDIFFSNLVDKCMLECASGLMDHIPVTQYQDILGQLNNSGLMSMTNLGVNGNIRMTKLRIEGQLDEVQSALRSFLESSNFHRNLSPWLKTQYNI